MLNRPVTNIRVNVYEDHKFTDLIAANILDSETSYVPGSGASRGIEQVGPNVVVGG